MTTMFTEKHRTKLEQYLETHKLPAGLGSEESACSIAAINLAIRGELTDDIPDCMSKVLGRTTIALQDEMPDEMRNSSRHKKLLPDMAGTGREHEKERSTILLDWMWSVVLPKLQPIASEYGFGTEWHNMCQEKTSAAATRAYDAARAADYAPDAARAAGYAADVADDSPDDGSNSIGCVMQSVPQPGCATCKVCEIQGVQNPGRAKSRESEIQDARNLKTCEMQGVRNPWHKPRVYE